MCVGKGACMVSLFPARWVWICVFRIEFGEDGACLIQITERFKLSNTENVWKASESLFINYTTAQHQPWSLMLEDAIVFVLKLCFLHLLPFFLPFSFFFLPTFVSFLFLYSLFTYFLSFFHSFTFVPKHPEAGQSVSSSVSHLNVQFRNWSLFLSWPHCKWPEQRK